MAENETPEADETIDGPEVVAHSADTEDEDLPWVVCGSNKSS